MTELLANVGLESKDGNVVSAKDALKGKKVALYFSAHWCPPCRGFTPQLSEFYQKANEDSKQFEVVFVSSDDDAEKQSKYMEEMHADWLRIKYDDPMREQLKQKYGCFAGKEQEKWPEAERRSGIPSLVVVEADGKEAEFDARELVQKCVETGSQKDHVSNTLSNWPES
eukprot:gnl/MRDRNA2_/MRDRNA2_54605_c0_seq1.p1 gnl/MRDRNA2_/MRDRNA2_54605_c0~~gnl/MRDRNA2_/MRDRNA2_54605_c0_seq1.p1  ORF type:complete len:184 (+),score=51.33 gnl/MRDRNA2_/MRDRNA2_54605_c0_seq1:47-553(+)